MNILGMELAPDRISSRLGCLELNALCFLRLGGEIDIMICNGKVLADRRFVDDREIHRIPDPGNEILWFIENIELADVLEGDPLDRRLRDRGVVGTDVNGELDLVPPFAEKGKGDSQGRNE